MKTDLSKSLVAGLIVSSMACPITFANERNGESLFNDYCFACHGTGWENAPVIGDDFAWRNRITKGLDVLLKNTIEGINTMPPKGTCDDCTDEELQSVIEYMTTE